MRPVLQSSSILRYLLLVTCTAALTGCAGKPQNDGQTPEISSSERCRNAHYFTADLIADRNRTDAQYQPIAGYPYYRVDRFHTSFREELRKRSSAAEMRREWLQRLAALATESRNIEIANLSTQDQNLLRHQLVKLDPGAIAKTSQDYLRDCATQLTRDDLENPDTVHDLIEGANAADLYSTPARIAGAYWATRWLSLAGSKDWQEEMRTRYASEQLDKRRLIRMSPETESASLSAPEIAHAIRQARKRSPLGIPELDSALLGTLTAQFAPALEISPKTLSDLIGKVQWNRHKRLDVTVSEPAVYTMHSYTRWRRQTLLQLNYVFWFPRREATGITDPYAGKLDGLIWRVTLGKDGKPVFYDAIHTCGCYHVVFPLQRDMLVRRTRVGEEGSLVFNEEVPDASRERLVLEISPGDHQILAVKAQSESRSRPIKQRGYAMRAYTELRSLPTRRAGRRSMFDDAGLVAGSERGERMFLWPMGVQSAGTMRQWGHHAISLAGKRHFDDPDLMKNLFYRAWR